MQLSDKTTITEKPDGKLVITIEIAPCDAANFLEEEENLALLLNAAGVLATQLLLKKHDCQAPIIESEGVRYYRKSSQKKSLKVPMAP